MISRTEIAALEGDESLRTFARGALEGVNLPESSRTFLQEVGLPRKAKLLLEFDFPADHLPSLLECAEVPWLNLERAKHLRRIGTDYGTQLCLDEEQGGAVISIDIEAELPERFINSSIEQFAECLVAFYKLARSRDGSSDKEAELVSRAEDEFGRIDVKALASPENWWSLIFEQIKSDS